jgi:hypothetical protein
VIDATRSRVGFLFRPFRINAGEGYLNTPPMTKAKKITAVAKSNPATIFFLRAAPRRAADLRG